MQKILLVMGVFGLIHFGLVQTAFIVFKLFGVIDWSWFSVLFPVIGFGLIMAVFSLVILLIVAVGLLIMLIADFVKQQFQQKGDAA